MDTTNTKSLTDAGYVLMSHLAKLGLFPDEGAKVVIYRGREYRFHSTLAPTGILVDEGQDHHVSEAKPKGVKELRLLDACATIEAMTAPDAADLGLMNLKAQWFERTPRRLPDHREDVWDDDLEFEGE